MLFVKHLTDNNQTYFEHIQDSWSYSYRSLKASVCFFIHGLFPWSFEHDGSDTIFELSSDLDEKINLSED